jgi:hypothetical protein
MSQIFKTTYLAHERSPILPPTFVTLSDKPAAVGCISASPLLLNLTVGLGADAGLQTSLCRMR